MKTIATLLFIFGLLNMSALFMIGYGVFTPVFMVEMVLLHMFLTFAPIYVASFIGSDLHIK